MRKLLWFIVFVVSSVLIAGIYGAVHNQFTLKISSEFFTHFLFPKFGLSDYFARPEWLGAFIVGWEGTWWVGLFSGIFIGGIWIDANNLNLWTRYRALGIMMSIAILFGVAGFLFGYCLFSEDSPIIISGSRSDFFSTLSSVSNPNSFIRAGIVHNSSYIGGLIGLILGIISLWRAKRKPKIENNFNDETLDWK